MKKAFFKQILAMLVIGCVASIYAQDEAVTDDPQAIEAAEESASDNVTEDTGKGEDSPAVKNENGEEGASAVKEGDSTAKEGDSGKAEKDAGSAKGQNIYSDGRITYATTGAKFLLKAEDSLSTLKHIEYKIDDNNYQIYTEPFQLTSVTEGRHTVTYRSIDKVGNKEPDNVYSIIIDDTPPEIMVTYKEGFFQGEKQLYAGLNSKAELKATDKFSGVKNIEYSLNGEESKVYSEIITFDKGGLQNVQFKATDNVGNVSPEQKFIVFVDDKGPVVEIKPVQKLTVINGKNYSVKENYFSIEAKDNDSGVAQILVKVDGDTEFHPYATKINFAEEGDHKIEAKAVDNVGNESQVVVLELTVDNNPPKTMLEPVSEEGTSEEPAAKEDKKTENTEDKKQTEPATKEEKTEDNKETVPAQ